jgi:hypothetical protein
MDPDPAIFVTDLQDANKKRIKKTVFLLTSFFKDKKSKRSHKTVGINGSGGSGTLLQSINMIRYLPSEWRPGWGARTRGVTTQKLKERERGKTAVGIKVYLSFFA